MGQNNSMHAPSEGNDVFILVTANAFLEHGCKVDPEVPKLINHFLRDILICKKSRLSSRAFCLFLAFVLLAPGFVA